MKTISSITILRICAMFCILIFHALCFYIGSWNYWRTEIVPIWSFFEPIVEIGLATFIFISGFLYGYYNIEKSKYLQFSPFVTKKTKRLLFPYIIWSCIMIIFLPLNMHWREMITGTGHLWFLLVLYEPLRRLSTRRSYTLQTSIHSASGQACSSSAIVSRTALWSVPAAG